MGSPVESPGVAGAPTAAGIIEAGGQPDTGIASGDGDPGNDAPADGEAASADIDSEGSQSVPKKEQEGTPEWHQSRHDQLAARVGPLDRFLDDIRYGDNDEYQGGEAALRHLSDLGEMRADPAMRQVIEHFLKTKEVKVPQAMQRQPDDELDDDPWEDVPSAVRSEFEQLKQQNEELRSQVTGVTRTQSLEALERATNRWIAKYPELTGDEKTKVLADLKANAKELMKTPAGLKVLQSMDDAAMTRMGLPVIEPFRDAIYERRSKNTLRGRQEGATDAPSAVSTSGTDRSGTDRSNLPLSQEGVLQSGWAEVQAAIDRGAA